MDERCSQAERPSIPSAETSSSREAGVPVITVPAFVFSLGFGEGALMDPFEQRRAVEDSPSYDTQRIPVCCEDPRRDAAQYEFEGAGGESQNQQQPASIPGRDVSDEPVVSRRDFPSSILSTPSSQQQHSTASRGLRYEDEDVIERTAQRALFGYTDGDPTNRLVPQACTPSHQQRRVSNRGANDIEAVKYLEPQDSFGETVSCDQQPQFLDNVGLSDLSSGDKEDLSRQMLHTNEVRVPTNDLASHNEWNSYMGWEQQQHTGQGPAASPVEQSTQQSIVERHSHKCPKPASRVPADTETWSSATMPVLPSSPPSGHNRGCQGTQDVFEEPGTSKERELFGTVATPVASQPSAEHGTALDHSSTGHMSIESWLKEALDSTDAPVTSQEVSLHAACSDGAVMRCPGSGMLGGKAHQQQCIRDGCANPAVESSEWDGEYCSSECVVLHSSKVFSAWVARRLSTEGALQRTSLPVERPFLQH